MHPGIFVLAAAPLGESVWKTIGVIVVMAAVIAAAYWFTLFIGKRAAGAGGRSRVIRIVDRLALARDKQIVLLTVAGKTYLVGITNNEIRVLDDAVALPEEVLAKSVQETVSAPGAMFVRAADAAAGVQNLWKKRKGTGGKSFADFIHASDSPASDESEAQSAYGGDDNKTGVEDSPRPGFSNFTEDAEKGLPIGKKQKNRVEKGKNHDKNA